MNTKASAAAGSVTTTPVALALTGIVATALAAPAAASPDSGAPTGPDDPRFIMPADAVCHGGPDAPLEVPSAAPTPPPAAPAVHPPIAPPPLSPIGGIGGAGHI